MPRILIAGIGNIFLGDDAFGCEVVRELARRRRRNGVRIVDFGTRALDLAYALLDPYDFVILVDVTSRGRPAGSLYVIEPEVGESGIAETHQLDASNALALAQRMGAPLKRVVLVGCEPATFEPSVEAEDGLSTVVRSAVSEAVEMIESLVSDACMNYPSR